MMTSLYFFAREAMTREMLRSDVVIPLYVPVMLSAFPPKATTAILFFMMVTERAEIISLSGEVSSKI